MQKPSNPSAQLYKELNSYLSNRLYSYQKTNPLNSKLKITEQLISWVESKRFCSRDLIRVVHNQWYKLESILPPKTSRLHNSCQKKLQKIQELCQDTRKKLVQVEAATLGDVLIRPSAGIHI